MLQLMKPLENYIVPYDEAVVEAKKIMLDISDKQWQLGDLANRLEPKYGERTLHKFANEIGMSVTTLQIRRAVARAWPESFRRRNISFGIAQSLIAHPDRFKIVDETPSLTVEEARKIARNNKNNLQTKIEEREEEEIFPYQEPCTDCNTAVEQWQRSVSNMLGDILSFQSYWTHLFGEDWKNYPLPSSHFKLALEAKREFVSMVASLREHPHE